MAGATTDYFKCPCEFKAFFHHSYKNLLHLAKEKRMDYASP